VAGSDEEGGGGGGVTESARSETKADAKGGWGFG
jgi:hypothetical protein